ncbi:MAG: hypothetical protein DPW15_15955 [Chloroflexi bacterium]|nr:hypothetical protein [Chloroflexota bacterium]
MNPEINALLEKAKRSRKAAATLFKEGDIDFAVTNEQANEMLEWAGEFIKTAEEYLKTLPNEKT